MFQLYFVYVFLLLPPPLIGIRSLSLHSQACRDDWLGNFGVMTQQLLVFQVLPLFRCMCNKLEDQLETFDTSPVFGNI